MVAIVSGNGTGLLNTSASVLGQGGLFGSATTGSSKEGAYVNVANGNLILQDQDDFIAAAGVNLALTRTYNSQGSTADGVGAQWKLGVRKQVTNLTGTLNAVGSTLTRIDSDGSAFLFKWDSSRSAYVSTDGDGAYQTIVRDGNNWVWRSSRNDLLGLHEIYDALNNGRITTVKDEVGVRLSYQYDTAGQLAQIADASGDITYFDFQNGNLTQIRTDPAGPVTSFVRTKYTYDTLNRLTSVTVDLTPENTADARTYTTSYTYSGDTNRIETLKQSDGTALTFSYVSTASGWKVATVTDGLGRRTSYDYSVAGKTTVTDPLNNKSEYSYDSLGQLVKVTQITAGGPVATSVYSYDASGNVLSVTDPNGTTRATYDARGNQIQLVDAAGNVTNRSFDAVSNALLTETYGQAAASDPVKNGTFSDSSVWGVTNGQISSGQLYLYSNPNYSYANQAITTVAGQKYTLTLDASNPNNCWFAVGASWGGTELAFTSLVNGKNTITFTASGTTTNLTIFDFADYSTYPYATTTIDNVAIGGTSGPTKRYVYDALHRPVYVISPEGRVTQYAYNASGQLASQTEYSANYYSTSSTVPTAAQMDTWVASADKTNSIQTRYSYDARGLISKSTQYTKFNADGTTAGTSSDTLYTYGMAGELLSTTDADGHTTSYSYDGLGRVLTTTGPNNAIIVNAYDDAANTLRTTMTDGRVHTSVYDKAGQLINVSDTLGTTNLGTTVYGYDAAGHLRMTQSPTGRRTFMLYDDAGRKVADIDADGTLTEYIYNSANNISRVKQYAARINVAAYSDTVWPAKLADVRPTTVNPDDRSVWNTYDGMGRLLDSLDGEGYLTRRTYDVRGRMAQVTRFATQLAVGTLTDSPASFTVGTSTSDRTTRSIYDNDGKLLGVLDPEGYLTENRYNAAGQLVQTTHYANPTADANRTSSAIATLRPSVSTSDQTQRFIYDAEGRLVGTVDAKNYLTEIVYTAAGNIKTRTTYNNPVAAGFADSVKIDTLRPVSNPGDRVTSYQYNELDQVTREVSPAGVITNYTYDLNGNQISATVGLATSAESSAQYRYDTFGHVIAELSPIGVAQLKTAGTDSTAIANIWKAYATTYTYDTDGLKTSATDANGNRTVYYYDADGRLNYSVDAKGGVVRSTYNAFGQVSALTRYAVAIPADKLAGLAGGSVTAAFTTIVNALPNSSNTSTELFYYDHVGNLTDHADALQFHTITKYNPFGEATAVLQPGTAGSVTANTAIDANSRVYYDRDGRVTMTVSGAGVVTAYQYDGLGNVLDKSVYDTTVTVSDTDTTATILSRAGTLYAQRQRYVYDARGQAIAVFTATSKSATTWTVTSQAYDVDGNLTASTTYAKPLSTTAPTLASVSSMATDPSDQLVRYYYDNGDRLTATATAQRVGTSGREWSVTKREYDAAGNVSAVMGFATQLKVADPTAADINTFTTSNTNLADQVTRYVYDSANRVIATAVAQGVENGNLMWSLRSMSYDAVGNVTASTEHATKLSSKDFAGDYRLWILAGTAVSSDPEQAKLDRTTRYGYDELNRNYVTVDPANAVTRRVYDAKGNVVQTIAYANLDTKSTSTLAKPYAFPTDNDADRITRTVYDANDRVAYTIDALGFATEYRYDSADNVITKLTYAKTVTLARTETPTADELIGKVTGTAGVDRTERYVYDPAGRLRYSVDAAGYVTENKYDGAGRVLSTTLWEVKPTTLPVDLRSVSGWTSALSGKNRTTSYTYDAQGNVLTATDALGKFETYTYDALGRKLTFTNKLQSLSTWSYIYDAAGRVIQETSPQVSTTKNATYVTANGTWDAQHPVANTAAVTRLTYDAFGNVATRTETAVAYDGSGNVIAGTDAAGVTGLERTTTYYYDAAGRQVQTVLPSIKIYDGSADPKSSAGTAATYEKESGQLSTVVTYNAFGEAVTNKDVGGNLSSKVYDNRGQVVYERDALNYVTEYQRDAFGNVVKLVRHAVAYDGSLNLSLDTLRTLIKSDSQDRIVTTSYDRLDRAVKTVEPQAYIYDADANAGDLMLAARTVDTEYDGFNQVIRRSVYGANASGAAVTAAASNYYFYNVLGQKNAELAVTQPASGTTTASGYLTTYDYDAAGNLLSMVEFASTTSLTSMTAAKDGAYGYVALTYQATATSNDRKTSYTYDNLNRKRSETQENALYTDTASGITQRGSLTTSYDYDVLGNQTMVTDALGNITYTQYDKLGRVTAIKKVPPAGTTAANMPLTVFKLDVFGNVVLRIDYVQGAYDNSATNFSAKVVDVMDRKTATAYDRNGNATQVTRGVDNEKYMTFTSYDMFGRAAKQWSTVTTAIGVQTAYTITNYDVLGRVSSVITPANAKLDDPNNTTSAQSVTRVNRYNMFGELTQRDLQDSEGTRTIETDAYDNAGHLWRSNADDGVTKIMAYDAQGNVTSVVRSTSTAAVNPLNQLASIAGVFSQNNLLRTDTRYDLLGHVIGTMNVGDMSALRRDPKTDMWTEVHTAFSQDDLLIVSRPDEAAKTVTLSYRLAGSTAWIDAASDRLQTINGYRVFATAGLPSGAYEYRVRTQGVGESAFISASGTVQVAATTDDVKDMKVLRLFAVLFKRAPTVAELDSAMNRLNGGATLAQVAQSLLDTPEVKAYLSATPATAMQQIFADALGRTGSGDASYTNDLNSWTTRYQKINTVAGDNRGQTIVDLIDTTLASLDTSAAAVNARNRINNRAAVAALYTITWRGANATSAASVLAAADQATSGAITLDAAKATATNTGKLEFQRNQIAQLYVTLLGRAPDPAGMFYWFDERVAVGACTVEAVADAMLTSDEATSDPALYPNTNLSTAQYQNQLVTHAYQTMLGRVPNTAELTGWLNKLNGTNGEMKITNAQFALQLADSVAAYSGTDTARLVEKQLFDNRVAVALAVGGLKGADGKPLPVTGKAINILIQAVNADSNSVASANAALQTIRDAGTANAAITTATAALAATTPLETARFKLAKMYAVLLNRAPDADGFAFYLSPLPTTREAWVNIAKSLLWSNESRTDASLTVTKSVNGVQQATTDAEFVQRVYDLAFNGPFVQSVGVKAEMATFVKMLTDGKSREDVAVAMIDGMLGFTGRSPNELTLKDLLDNKAAVGVAMAVDMKIIDGATQLLAMRKVTSSDINTAINYAYAQNQTTIAARFAANSVAGASSASALDATATALGQKVTGDNNLASANAAMAAVANASRYLDLIRLYVGFLGRTPDEAGIKFYFSGLSTYTSEALAQAIYQNAEASGTGGLYPPTLSNAEFVQRVYDKTFGTSGITPPDSATWIQQLQSGVQRGVVAMRIIQSVVAYTNGEPDATAQKYLNGKQSFSQRVKDALATLKSSADAAEAPVLSAAQSLHTQLDALNITLNSANASKNQALSYASSMMSSANYSGDGLADYRLKLNVLYKTLLKRTSAPTQAEMNFWTNGGAPLDQVAQSMITSSEGAPYFGSLDNTSFVQLIYQRILNRAPDSSGLSFWVSRLAAGVSRGAVAMGVLQDFLNYSDYLSSQLVYKQGFDASLDSMLQTEMWDASSAKSNAYSTWSQALSNLTTTKSTYDQAVPARDQALTAYNSARSAAVDAHTIAANPSAQRSVTYIYVCLRGYTDLGGVAFWIWSGDTDKLISDLMPGGDNRGFVLGLYSMVLGRTPREDEVSYWVNVLNAGNSRVEVAKSFMYSSEGHTFNDSLSNRAISTDTSTVNSLLNAETQAAQRYNTASTNLSNAYTAWQNAVTAEATANTAYTKASKAYDSFAALANAHTYVTTADDRYRAASKAQEDVNALTPSVTAKDAELAPLKAYSDANDTAYDVANASYTVATASVALISSFNTESSLPVTAQQVKTVAQIYAAIIGKQPTVSALKYWTDKLAAGTDVVQVISGIMSGPEATQAKLFPAGMSNDAFVTQMYATALGRGFAADPGGLRFWSDQLSGPNALPRAQLVRDWIKSLGTNANSDTVTFDRKVANILYTATSAANTVKADTTMPSAGVNIADYGSAYAAALANAAPGAAAAALPAADYVLRATRLYVAILDRTPDANGLIFWANGMMNAGVSDVEMADKMLTSAEAQSYYDPNQDKIQFATQISKRLLSRSPTYQEQTSFYNMSKAEIIVAIVNASKNPVENLTQQESLNLFNGKVMAAVTGVQAALVEYTSALTNATNLLNGALAAGVVDRHSEQVVYGVNDQIISASITTGQISYSVDRWGNVLTMSDARNANVVTSYTYNANNQAIETAVPGTSGGVLKQVNEYDKLGRLRSTSEIAQSTGVSERAVYEYDFKGALVKETHADGGYLTYTTDAFNQRLTSNQYLSASQTVTYSYVYDRMGNLISRTSGPVTVYDWYGYGAATSSTASYSRYIVDAYAYDELGRRTTTSNYYSTASNASTNASATKEGFTVTSALVYDLGGNIIKSTDANGLTTYRAYNALNNKVAEREATTAQGSVNALTLRWTYDDYGHVLTHTDLGGAVTRNTYNAAGQLASTTRTGGGGGIPAQTTNYVYESGTGNLVEVSDDNYVNGQWLHEQVRYGYDRAGNRIAEQTWLKDDQGQLQRAIQDNALAYDARGQLTDITAYVTGADYRIHYNYDAFGNRDAVTTTLTNDVGDKKTITVNYKYDLMNRMKEVSGTVNTTYGNPVYTRPLPSYKYEQVYEDWGDGVESGWKYFDNKAIDSHVITYDWAGNRTKDNAETYFYDAAGRLSTIQTNGVQTGYRYYDSASRVIESRDGTEKQLNDYDAGGRIIVQRSLGYSDNVQHSLVRYTYDASFGFLSSYTAQGSTSAKWQTTTNNNYALAETRMLSKTTVQNDGESSFKYSTMEYDVAGNMSRVTATIYKDSKYTEDQANSRTMISDYAGHVLEKTQNGLRTHTLMANDEMIGYSSTAYESFSSVYEGLSNASKADISTYVVQSSTETLRSIAKSIWGDERLWYVIADANGLTTSDAPLTVGQPLQIPAQAGTAFNGADTFKPYNAAEIIGSTTPEVALPVPQQSKGGGCGGLGQLVMVVVAVVATIYTAGAAAEFFAGGLSAVGSAGFAGTMAAGVGVGSAGFSAAAVAAGAIGGAMGSIASQVVGMAIGAQDGFNWKGVALSAIGGGVSAGVGGTFGKDVFGAMGRAALSNTITQGVSIVTGLQHGFDWRGVAAATAGGAASFGANGIAEDLKLDNIFTRTATGIASGTATAIARGGKIDFVQIFTDSFGNALANSLIPGGNARGDSNPDRSSKDRYTASLTDSEFAANVYGQMRARLADYGPDARADFATDEELGYLERAADENGGVLPRAGEFAPAPEITSADLTIKYRVHIVGKRNSVSPRVPDLGRVVLPTIQRNVQKSNTKLPPNITKTQIRNWNSNKNYFLQAAAKSKVNVGTLVKIGFFESRFNAAARPIAGKEKAYLNTEKQFDGVMAMSTGYGFGQFLDDTWQGMLRKYGANYGIPDAKNLTAAQAAGYRADANLQAAMLAEFTKENIAIGQKIGGPNDDANVYALHNLGAGAGKKFLAAYAANPNELVENVLSKKVIAGNSSLYGNGRISVRTAYDNMAGAMNQGNYFVQQAQQLILNQGKVK